MSKSWITVDAKLFLECKIQTKKIPHSLTKKVCAWRYCAHCGLVTLNNDETRKAFKKLCEVVL